MLPQPNTKFLPLSELEGYCNRGYHCHAIVFSPETENNHFKDCPPYIALYRSDSDHEVYFLVPEEVAYYGRIHAGYTMAGRERSKQSGRSELQYELRELLGIKDDD